MKLFAKIFAALISAALVFSSVPVCFASQGISYVFTGDEKDAAGYAEGKIELSGLSDGAHYLWWADDSAALGGYYEITKIKGSGSFKFGDHTAIPAGATKIIATADKKNVSVSSAEAVYEIPESKRLKYKPGDENYTFMSYSDIHIDKAQQVFYRHSELHWQKALETAQARGADFIVTAGDNVTGASGTIKEFDKYQEILADSPYTGFVYEASGNHELRGGKPKKNLKIFAEATGLNCTPSEAEKAKPYYYVEEPNSGDLFIFMALEYQYSPEKGDEFSDAQLEWLENLLAEHYGRNRNIFIMQHALIEGYGAGDAPDNYYTVPLFTEYESTVRFREIIQNYPEIVWISGHTHIAFKYGFNFSNMNDTSCYMIHDSSVCCPTFLNKTSHKLSYIACEGEEYKDCTEGYYVQVFDGCSIFNGENLYHDKIYPASTYIIDGCRKTKGSYTPAEKPAEKSVFADSDTIALYAEQALTAPMTLEGAGHTDQAENYLRKKAKIMLKELYTFSSYDDYQRLKRAVNNNESFDSLCAAYRAVLPFTRVGGTDVYFTDTLGWGKAYAELSSANSPAVLREMLPSGEDADGNAVFRLSVNVRRYNSVVFTNGTEEGRTDPQTLINDGVKNYVLNSNDPEPPYFCLVREYEKQ